MAHTRLSIIGTSAEAGQPMESDNSDLALVYNGEIYNYVEVARKFNIDSRGSDARLLCEGLSRLGPDFLQHLRGMYAFVAWDEKLGRLWAGRDPHGIKPLYLRRHIAGGLTLASTPLPLLKWGDSVEVDPIGVAEYLAHGRSGPLTTVYRDVVKLSPGVLYSWEKRQRRWEQRCTQPAKKEEASVTTDLSEALDDTVRAHLVADVPVGIFLSGGVDSTLLAASSAGLGQPLRGFSITYPECPEIDESTYVKQNGRALGMQVDLVEVTIADMARSSAGLTSTFGEPISDMASIPLSILSRTASQQVKVVLTGEGADELFAGYARYSLEQALAHIPKPVMVAAGLILQRVLGMVRRDSSAWRAMHAAALSDRSMGHLALLGSEVPAILAANLPFSRDLLARHVATWNAATTDVDGTNTPMSQVSYDRRVWLPNVYLEKTDRATMAHSLEARVPYLDAVFTNSVPHRVEPGKPLLVGELRRRVPGVVLPNRKKGLSVPTSRLLQTPELSGRAASALGRVDGVIRCALGAEWKRFLDQRSQRSVVLTSRLALLDLWEEQTLTASR